MRRIMAAIEQRPSSGPPGRWLSIVGIGEDGPDGLSPRARRLVEAAELVFGGRRHLDLAGDLVKGEANAWPSPFSVEPVLAARGRPTCVLASGDPFLHGVGATLARHVPPSEMEVVPAASAFSLAASRLGWPLHEVVTLSLHGRPLELVGPHLHPRTRLLVLTSDSAGPRALAGLLVEAGFRSARLIVLEALGGVRERIRERAAGAFDVADVDPLNLVAIETGEAAAARILSFAPGLDDALFEHDGQLTRREVRALTLSALAPRRGEMLWDIGAGAGSVAIEWMLADASLRAVAVEARAERAGRIVRNARRLGVPGLRVVTGEAPAAMSGLPPPDAIFIGGGGSDPGVIEVALAALSSAGRLVANAVTLETEAVLLARHAALGGSLLRVALSRAAPLAGMTGWRPAMPITQWAWTKP